MGNTTVVLFSVMRPEYPDDCSLPSAAPLDAHLLTLRVPALVAFSHLQPLPGESVHAQGVKVPEPRLLPLLVLDPFC